MSSYNKNSPGGGLYKQGYIYKQGSAEYFLGFESLVSVVLWVLVTDAVFFWVVK